MYPLWVARGWGSKGGHDRGSLCPGFCGTAQVKFGHGCLRVERSTPGKEPRSVVHPGSSRAGLVLLEQLW